MDAKAQNLADANAVCFSEFPPYQTTKCSCYVGADQNGKEMHLWELYQLGFSVVSNAYDSNTEEHVIFLKKETN
ncbi:MAG: hypothetical protein AAF066_02420 [Pseudomonadota bacterium]